LQLLIALGSRNVSMPLMDDGINLPIECISKLNISQEKMNQINSVRNLIPKQMYSIQFLFVVILFLNPRHGKQELSDVLQGYKYSSFHSMKLRKNYVPLRALLQWKLLEKLRHHHTMLSSHPFPPSPL
jgi:hypothetical protein